jgi:hypothetical protein
LIVGNAKRNTGKKMNVLYVIGNGFDLFHGLPTSFDDFQDFISENHKDLKNDLDAFFNLNYNKRDYWANFEKDLKNFDSHSFLDLQNNLNPMDDNFKPSSFFSLEDELAESTDNLIRSLKQALYNWVDSLYFKSISKKLSLKKNDFYLTFNYTLTLETIYDINPENTLHIHGSLEYSPDDLVIGHNGEVINEYELDKFENSERTMFTDSENISKRSYYELHKPVNDLILANKPFFNNLKYIEEINILGHSLNKIDLPYFEEICKNATKAIWQVTYKGNKEKLKFQKRLLGLGIKKEKINLKQMSDYNLQNT